MVLVYKKLYISLRNKLKCGIITPNKRCKNMAQIKLQDLFRAAGIRRSDEDELDKGQGRYYRQNVTITHAERQALYRNTYVPTDKDNKINVAEVLDVLNKTSRSVAQRKIDNERIRKLIPEINQASDIHTASILSPNDLQGNGLNIVVENPLLNDQQRQQITEVLETIFITNHDLENKLAEWVSECCYGAGAKPIMILPETTIVNEIRKSIRPAMEKIDLIYDDISSKWSYFDNKLQGSFAETKIEKEDHLIIKSGFEKISDGIANNLEKDQKNKFNKIFDNNTVLNEIEKTIRARVEDNGLISLEENPYTIKQAHRKTVVALESAQKKMQDFFNVPNEEVEYEKEPLVEIAPLADTDSLISNPILQELPPEAVIPGFIPGTPSDHLFYFLLLDKKGNPLTLSENDIDENVISDSYEAIFKDAFYGSSQLSEIMSGKSYMDSVNKLYENMLTKYIKNALEDVEIHNVDISLNNAVLSCMFRRLLLGKETKLLFVPKELMIYYRFDHMSDGTGKSRIEDIKFIISARLTLIVSEILAAVEDSIPRSVLNVTIDDKVTNPQRFMSQLKTAFTQSKLYSFSYNPTEIVQDIVTRNTGVKLNGGLPGIEKYEVETENNSTNRTRPDSDLREELKNMQNTSLGPPPAALNSLSEFEYSRSVATTNLLYNKLVSKDQRLVCMYTQRLIQSYAKYSGIIRNKILEIIKEDGDKQDDATELTVEQVIASIAVSLPSPNVAPSKAQYQEFSDILSIINDIFEQTMSDELLAADRDTAEFITTMRAMSKRSTVKEYISKSGFSSYIDIEDLEEKDQMSVAKLQQYLSHMKKMFDKTKSILENKDDNSGGNSYY